MSNTTKEVTTIEVTKAGDWVLPVQLKDGTIVHALQINKSKEDKENIETLLQEYANAGIPVMQYSGKNNNPVLLVEATKKLRSQRTSFGRDKFVETAMASFGVSREKAEQAYAEMQTAKAEAKASK